MFSKEGVRDKKGQSLASKGGDSYAETSSRVSSIGVKPLPLLIGRWKIKNQYLAVTIMATIIVLFSVIIDIYTVWANKKT